MKTNKTCFKYHTLCTMNTQINKFYFYNWSVSLSHRRALICLLFNVSSRNSKRIANVSCIDERVNQTRSPLLLSYTKNRIQKVLKCTYRVYIRVNLGHVELCLGFPPSVVPIFRFHVGCVLIVSELVDFTIYNRWLHDWIHVHVTGEVSTATHYSFIFASIENSKKIIFH